MFQFTNLQIVVFFFFILLPFIFVVFITFYVRHFVSQKWVSTEEGWRRVQHRCNPVMMSQVKCYWVLTSEVRPNTSTTCGLFTIFWPSCLQGCTKDKEMVMNGIGFAIQCLCEWEYGILCGRTPLRPLFFLVAHKCECCECYQLVIYTCNAYFRIPCVDPINIQFCSWIRDDKVPSHVFQGFRRVHATLMV